MIWIPDEGQSKVTQESDVSQISSQPFTIELWIFMIPSHVPPAQQIERFAKEFPTKILY